MVVHPKPVVLIRNIFIVFSLVFFAVTHARADDPAALFKALTADSRGARKVAQKMLKTYQGSLVYFEASQKKGKLRYQFEFLQLESSRVLSVVFDTDTGKVVKEKTKAIDHDLPSNMTDLASLTSLMSVWNSARTRLGALITEVELDREKGRFIYEVEFLKPDYEGKAMFDARTGQLIPVSERKR